MNLDTITNLFQFQLLFKAIVLVGGLFYVVLLVIIYRQAGLMTQILNSSVSPVIKLVAIIQIILAIIFFFLALFLL